VTLGLAMAVGVGCSQRSIDADATTDVLDATRDGDVMRVGSGDAVQSTVDGADGGDGRVPSCDAISDTPERWRRLPYACGCDARIALAPQHAAPPLRWVPCESSDGCLRLVVDWPRREPPSDIFLLREYRVNGERWIGYQRDEPMIRRSRWLLGPLEGAPTVAFESRDNRPDLHPGCSASLAAGPTPGVQFLWPIDDVGNVTRRALSLGPIDRVEPWLEPSVEIGSRWESIAVPYFSVYERSAATAIGGVLWRSNPTSRRFEAIARSEVLGGFIEATQLWDEQSWFLLSRTDDDVALWVVDGTQAPHEVFRPSPPRSMGYRVFEDHIVFFAGVYPNRTSYEGYRGQLFIAPRTTDPARFVPRLLWNMPESFIRSPLTSPVMGGGWIAFNVRTPRGDWMVLVRTSDGARIELRDRRPEIIAWIDSEEVAYSVRIDGHFTYERVKLRTLGPILPMQ
jgi:hypothetical protein